MRYYVDCEFNGSMGGQLISIALVSVSGREFYAVLPLPENPVPWISANVIPVLERTPEPVEQIRLRLKEFLGEETQPITFLADWPEDLMHLCSMLILKPLLSMRPASWGMQLLDLPRGWRTMDANPDPHNALRDARALRDYVEAGLEEGYGGRLDRPTIKQLRGT